MKSPLLTLMLLLGIVMLFSVLPTIRFEQDPLERGKIAYYGFEASGIDKLLLQPLATDGNAEAQYYVGLMHDSPYDFSLEGKQINNAFLVYNYVEAVKWYRLSAEQGFVLAQAELGRMYYYGHGVPADPVRAHMWLSLAIVGTPLSDRAGTAVRSSFRDTVASEMTPAQIAEAQRLAKEWLTKRPIR